MRNFNPKSKIEMVSGKGFEPLFTGSEPAVLPVRRPRKKVGGSSGGWQEPALTRCGQKVIYAKLEETEGLEPSTFSFVAKCSDSIELRLLEKLAVGSCGWHGKYDCILLLPTAYCEKIRLFSCQTSKKRSGYDMDLPMILA